MRQPWRQGMKVADLIPGRSFLLSQAAIKRQNDVLLSEEEKQRTKEQFGQSQTSSKDDARKVTDNEDTLAQRIGNLVDEINFEYAVIERVDREKVQVKLLSFNLGQALDNPSSPENIALLPGDVLTVFSANDVRVPQAKRQVYVRVEGEVWRPGIYQMKQGDSLPQLIEKAGGLTDDAYLFGAGFYREQVRKDQLANLDQLVRKLEMQTQSKLSASAASASVNDVAGAVQLRIQAEQQAQKQALDRLRNLKPTGRIMLGLQSAVAKPEALPTLRLENQDRLVVPARPDFVYVLGSVNTESSLIWRAGNTVQDYLEVSGLTSGADKDELFVIRADGSVLSNGDRWFGTVARAEVQPGDLIVLPEKADHESGWSVFTRNAKDITQIIYQFSLGAAAIKTLRQ
jgi:protein involved in polysaccharide export with SLBB domain